MKDKTFVFPLLVVLLSPFVWYTNQSGVDGIRGTHFLLNPFVFLTLGIVIAGCILLRNRLVFLVGNLLFIPAVFLYVYTQGKEFEGSAYSVKDIVSGLTLWGGAVISIAVAGCAFSIVQMARKREN